MLAKGKDLTDVLRALEISENASILEYSRINEHVLYIQKPAIGAFVQLVAAHSTRFDANAKEASRRTPPKMSVPRKPHSEDVKAGEPRLRSDVSP